MTFPTLAEIAASCPPPPPASPRPVGAFNRNRSGPWKSPETDPIWPGSDLAFSVKPDGGWLCVCRRCRTIRSARASRPVVA